MAGHGRVEGMWRAHTEGLLHPSQQAHLIGVEQWLLTPGLSFYGDHSLNLKGRERQGGGSRGHSWLQVSKLNPPAWSLNKLLEVSLPPFPASPPESLHWD